MDILLDRDTIKQRILDSINKSKSEKSQLNKSTKESKESKESNNTTDSTDTNSKLELRKKLRSAINSKKHASIIPKSELEEQKNNVMQMLKNPKITPHILKIYVEALAYNPEKSIPSPLDLINDKEKYTKEYYEYILTMAKSMKQNNIPVSELDNKLDNPYARYISTCLECKLNPFKKTSVKPKDEPISESKDEPISKPEPISESKDEPISESKDEPISESKDEPISESKDEPISESKDEPISESKYEPISESKDEPISESKDEPISESKDEPISELKDDYILIN